MDQGSIEKAVGVGVDQSGDVIVGGFTASSKNADDFNLAHGRNCSVFKLDGETGAEVWRYYPVGQESGSRSSGSMWVSNAAIVDLAIDSGGDALFVGYAWSDSVEVSEWCCSVQVALHVLFIHKLR